MVIFHSRVFSIDGMEENQDNGLEFMEGREG